MVLIDLQQKLSKILVSELLDYAKSKMQKPMLMSVIDSSPISTVLEKWKEENVLACPVYKSSRKFFII